MEDAEVLQIVGDLGKKEGTKIEAVADDVDQQPLPEAEPWPALDEDAYHGIAGELIRTIAPESEADPVGLLVSLLCSLGSVVGRSPHFLVEGTSHHANLYAILVGSTSRGRKGTSSDRIKAVLRFVDEAWLLDRVVTGLVSGEGLIWNVRDPIWKQEAIKDRGRIVGHEDVLADPGIEDKRLLVIESEFASCLRACRRETNTLSPTLRSAWDSGHLRTLAKNSPAKATDAHVSILAHITNEELRRTLPEVEGFSGFANRFLWIAVRRSRLLPEGGAELDLSGFAERLVGITAYGRTVERMRRDQEAVLLWREIYTDLAEDRFGGLLGAATSRAEAQTLRLSLIYALLDQSPTIRVEHLRAAHAVWRYAEQSACRIFGTSTGDSLADKLLVLIQGSPGISRRELHRATGNHHKAAVLVSALAKLRDLGLAHPEKIKTGGRPREGWYPGSELRTNEQRSGAACEQSEQRGQGPGGEGLSSLSSFVRKSNSEEKPPDWEEIVL